MKKVFSVLFMLLFVMCLCGCGSNEETDVIKLGSCGPLSGSASIYGQAVKKGLTLAIDEINSNGGVNVNGKMMQFKLVDFINDEANPTKAATALTTLISKDVDVIVGAVTSGATEGLIAESMQYGVPIVTPTGTADMLTVGQKGDERAKRSNVFRACFYDSDQGNFMAEYISKLGYKKAYVLYNNDDDYSVGLKDAFVSTAKQNKVEVKSQGYGSDITDFNSFWVPIINEGYECVFIPDYYETVYNILKTGYNAGYTGKCYGGDGWDGVIRQSGADKATFLENCFYTNHYFGGSESEVVKKFVEAFENKYDESPVSFAALAYDAVYIVKQAIEAAGSLEYAKVINALETGTFTGLVTSSKEVRFENGNPKKDPVVITFKNGKEVETK